MNDIYNYKLKDLEQYFKEKNELPFKAVQVFEWIYKKKITSFLDMRNVSKKTINDLNNDFYFSTLKLEQQQISKDTNKYLFNLSDNNKIEAVLMKHDYGNSLCISTQVGCNMGCAFCESGRLKKVRNLSASEMVLQILEIEKISELKINSIVLMGIGEPFDNYDSVIDFVDIINTGKGIDIGARHITISTCGIVPKIKEFSNYEKQVNLAISLHAPNDEIRNKIMPINKAYNIKELISALKEYIKKTNRRVTLEYILLDNINDTDKCAHELAKLIRGMNCYVNLIPYNETTHIQFKKSSKEKIMNFYDILKKEKINVTIRREFGNEISGACGQLRSHYEGGNV
ncbi:MAG: 23S rRNA (adenine(2503)-C(2))-methyltransferase RlmN [Mycoplasmatota bacterium]